MIPIWLQVPAAAQILDQKTIGKKIRIILCSNEFIDSKLIYKFDILNNFISSNKEFEILSPSMLGSIPLCHRIARDDANQFNIHLLDLALSTGRHAAERAKLHGCDLLIGFSNTNSICKFCEFNKFFSQINYSPEQVYQLLKQTNCFAMITLIGLAIASAQMGILIWLDGLIGRNAARIAICLHSELHNWLLNLASNR